jgi:hypothetical protein
MQPGRLEWTPANYNALIREKVLRNGERGLTRREKKWYRVMEERDRAARNRYLFSNYYTPHRSTFRRAATPSESSEVMSSPSIITAANALNQRLKQTLRRARSAEKRGDRPTVRGAWKNLANIGQEYQRQGRRYSEKLRSTKAELQQEEEDEAEVAVAAAPPPPYQQPIRPVGPIPIISKKPEPLPGTFYRRYQFALPGDQAAAPLPPLPEETYREPRFSWGSPLQGGRHRTRKTEIAVASKGL